MKLRCEDCMFAIYDYEGVVGCCGSDDEDCYYGHNIYPLAMIEDWRERGIDVEGCIVMEELEVE